MCVPRVTVRLDKMHSTFPQDDPNRGRRNGKLKREEEEVKKIVHAPVRSDSMVDSRWEP